MHGQVETLLAWKALTLNIMSFLGVFDHLQDSPGLFNHICVCDHLARSVVEAYGGLHKLVRTERVFLVDLFSQSSACEAELCICMFEFQSMEWTQSKSQY